MLLTPRFCGFPSIAKKCIAKEKVHYDKNSFRSSRFRYTPQFLKSKLSSGIKNHRVRVHSRELRNIIICRMSLESQKSHNAVVKERKTTSGCASLQQERRVLKQPSLEKPCSFPSFRIFPAVPKMKRQTVFFLWRKTLSNYEFCRVFACS